MMWVAIFGCWTLVSFIAATVFARVIRITKSGDHLLKKQLPGGDRQHFADQRLERRGFGEGGSVHHHGKDI